MQVSAVMPVTEVMSVLTVCKCLVVMQVSSSDTAFMPVFTVNANVYGVYHAYSDMTIYSDGSVYSDASVNSGV